MAPDDQPQADDPTEADDPRELHDGGPEAPDAAGPAAGSADEPVESDALVRLRELRERMRSQFDSLHGEIESLRRPPSERGEAPAPAEVAVDAERAEAPVGEPADAVPVDAVPAGVVPVDAEPDEAPVVEAGVDAEAVIGGPDEDHEAPAGADDLDLAAAGAGVDPGIFYAPAERTELDDPEGARAGDAGQGASFFDVEAEGWDGSTGPASAPPDVTGGPVGTEAGAGVEHGSHGLPDWVFGAHQAQPSAPADVGPPNAGHPHAGPAGGAAAAEQWSGAAPWPDAAPLGDAERMFNPAGSGVRRVVTAVLVFALVVALVILVIQLLDDGESTDQGAGARPVAVVDQIASPPA